MTTALNRFLAFAGFTLLATPALAHTGGAVSGFLSGVSHPVMGPDHLAAMVAVGVYAATQAKRTALLGPLVFLAMLAAGAFLGVAGVPMAGVEPGILASVVVLGLMAAFGRQLPAVAGLTVIGGFALLHGHAHGTEATGAFSGYLAGFMLASASLHAAGYGFGRYMAGTRYGLIASGFFVAAGGLVLAAG